MLIPGFTLCQYSKIWDEHRNLNPSNTRKLIAQHTHSWWKQKSGIQYTVHLVQSIQGLTTPDHPPPPPWHPHPPTSHTLPKVSEMLSWSTKNPLHSINIWDTVTKVVPLCSLYQAPSYEPNLTLLAWYLPDITYLSMLFILEMVCTACSADHLKNK